MFVGNVGVFRFVHRRIKRESRKIGSHATKPRALPAEFRVVRVDRALLGRLKRAFSGKMAKRPMLGWQSTLRSAKAEEALKRNFLPVKPFGRDADEHSKPSLHRSKRETFERLLVGAATGPRPTPLISRYGRSRPKRIDKAPGSRRHGTKSRESNFAERTARSAPP